MNTVIEWFTVRRAFTVWKRLENGLQYVENGLQYVEHSLYEYGKRMVYST